MGPQTNNSLKTEIVQDSLLNDSGLRRQSLSSQHTVRKATIWVLKLPAHQMQLLWVEETSESLV